jgi:hypothetical protein
MEKWKTKCGDKVVKHGAKGYKIGQPGTAKWKSYCSRSGGIAKKFPSAKEPCSPNMLSRKKWKCGSYGLALLFMLFISISLASALTFDNIKSFEKGELKYGKVTITNAFGLGSVLEEITLLDNSDKCSNDCYAEKEIKLYSDGSLIDDVRFLRLMDNGKWVESSIRSYKFLIKTNEEEYKEDTYEWQCNPTGKISSNGTAEETCSNVKTGTVTKKKPSYEEYQLGTERPKGTYTVRLEGSKRADWTYDWQITTQGKLIEDWSVWGVGAGSYMTHGQDGTSSTAVTEKHGLAVTMKTTSKLINVTLMTSSGATKAYIYNGTSGTVIASADIVNGNASFSNYLYEGQVYDILADNNGDTYTRQKDDDDHFPYDLTLLYMNYSVYYSPTRNTVSSTVLSIKGLTFEEFSIVTLNSPANYYNSSINLITFNATANVFGGATLTNMSLWTNSTGTWKMNSTLYGENGLLNVSAYSNSNNAFDWNSSSTASGTGNGATVYFIGKTFNSQLINRVIIDGATGGIAQTGSSPSPSYCSIKLQGYNGGTWSDIQTLATQTVDLHSSPCAVSYSGTVDLNTNYEGLRLYTSTGFGGAYPDSYATVNDFKYLDWRNSSTQETQVFISNLYSTTIWGIQACDSDGACGFSENRTVSVDATPPTISIAYPIGTINGLTNGQSVQLNYSVSDTNLDSCWYEYNGANSSAIPSCANTTFTYASGINTIKVWANDSVGNLGSDSKTFNVGLQINSVTYSPTTYSTKTESFYLNATYNASAYTSVTAIMVYNNTNYSSTIVGSGNSLISTTLAVPSISAYTNKTFYWAISLDGTEYLTESYNQSVYPVEFGICGGSLTSEVINFTTYSASNPFPVINATFKSAWDISATIGGLKASYNFEDISEKNNTWRFCTAGNLTIYADAHLEYDAGSYALNSYYLSNSTLENATKQSVKLYLLNDSLATTTVLKVRDNSKAGIEDATIQIQFYDVGTGTFYTVGMAKTDFKGEDIAYLNWYDSLYKFTITSNGELLKITNTSRITETPTYFDIEDNTVNEFDKFDDFVYSLTYNNVTKNFVLTFTKPSGEVDSGCLRVIKRTSSEDTTICESCETSTSATLYCNIGSYNNGTYIATFYATGSYKKIDWIAETIGGDLATSIYNALGKKDANFYSFLFGGIIVAVSFINPIFGVIGAVLGILGGAALGFSLLNYAGYIGICIIGIFIIWNLKK